SVEYRGRHTGYARLPEPVVHDRTFTWSFPTRMLRITDVFEARGTHRLRWHFHFAPGVSVEAGAPGQFDIVAGSRLRMTAPLGLRATIAAAWYSPSYGVRHPTVALDLESEAGVDSKTTYVFEIGPPEGGHYNWA